MIKELKQQNIDYKSQLETCKSQSNLYKSQLEICTSQLETCKSQLETCKSQSNLYKSQLEICTSQLETCKSQSNLYKSQLEIYKEQYIDQKNCIQDIAKQPKINTTSNNTSNTINILNNITPIDLDKIKAKEIIDLLWNKEDFYGGQKAAANFVVNNLLKDANGELMYRCTDPSRHVFKYKNVDGYLKKDVKAKKLTTLIGKHIKTKNKEIVEDIKKNLNSDTIQELSSDNIKEINTINMDNYNFREELSTLTS
jgi:hypothetical protein